MYTNKVGQTNNTSSFLGALAVCVECMNCAKCKQMELCISVMLRNCWIEYISLHSAY